jgi:hypothetical protein
MSVTQYISFQAQVEFLDRLTTAIGDVNVDKNTAATDPDLSV